MAPIQALPNGYQEAAHIVLTDPKRLLRLNLYALVPLVLALILLERWHAFARALWTPTLDLPALSGTVGVIIGIVSVLIVHEGLHGAAILAFGHRARFGAKLAQGVLYATADNAYFRRHEFWVVALTPLVVLSLVALVGIAIGNDALAWALALWATVNAAGAIGDLWSSWFCLRYPASALVKDEGDGFRVFMPAD